MLWWEVEWRQLQLENEMLPTRYFTQCGSGLRSGSSAPCFCHTKKLTFSVVVLVMILTHSLQWLLFSTTISCTISAAKEICHLTIKIHKHPFVVCWYEWWETIKVNIGEAIIVGDMRFMLHLGSELSSTTIKVSNFWTPSYSIGSEVEATSLIQSLRGATFKRIKNWKYKTKCLTDKLKFQWYRGIYVPVLSGWILVLVSWTAIR